MPKISTITELARLRDELSKKMQSRSAEGNPASIIQVRVALATCGIASGAKPVFDYLKEELQKRNIPAVVSKAGCMGYCYAEPTIEVTIPGKQPVTFGYVDTKKADEIIERYIRKGEAVEGVIEMDYETVELL